MAKSINLSNTEIDSLKIMMQKLGFNVSPVDEFVPMSDLLVMIYPQKGKIISKMTDGSFFVIKTDVPMTLSGKGKLIVKGGVIIVGDDVTVENYPKLVKNFELTIPSNTPDCYIVETLPKHFNGKDFSPSVEEEQVTLMPDYEIQIVTPTNPKIWLGDSILELKDNSKKWISI
jgi:hypothetical protein